MALYKLRWVRLPPHSPVACPSGLREQTQDLWDFVLVGSNPTATNSPLAQLAERSAVNR